MTSRNHDAESLALSPSNPTAKYICGDFSVSYVLDPRTSAVSLRLLPLASSERTVDHREHLETLEILNLPAIHLPAVAYRGHESLVEIKLAEDDSGAGFSGGRSMRLNQTVEGLRLDRQTVELLGNGGFIVRTMLRGSRNFTCTHVLRYESGDEAVTVHTEFENTGATTLTLEMLSTFSIGYLSPFDAEDSIDRLKIHRFRSLWSSEGRHEAVTLEDLHLERSWGSASVVNERFGQVGSMPVRGFFPFLAVEDIREGVFWGAQLGCSSSWQMEVYRRDDKVSISGGLADREFGHWMKRIAPAERFITPAAFLSTAEGGLDTFCQRLTRMQTKALANLPAIENDLPILFNEYCTSWGEPTPALIEQTSQRLQGTPVRIFVIDDGWSERPAGTFQFNGDWNVEPRLFPDGLRPTAQGLCERGLIPGLWFEFEVCTEGTAAFKLDQHKLRRDGKTLKVGPRHFWDFTDPWTFDYLSQKVISRLRDDGFGYIKVDYNDTIGLGCDDPDSLGEGLRKHMAGVERFYRRMREELPDLIIEVCASGGHRLEPSMLSLGSMGSFSDAHESQEIPIIAANLHRLILPRQSQIWAVLRRKDSPRRLQYSLASCFLGRACLSGDVAALTDEQWDSVLQNLHFYAEVKAVIRDGESRLYRDLSSSYRNPKGWQVVTRTSRSNGKALLVVAHSFSGNQGETFRIELPEGANWKLQKQMGCGLKVQLEKETTLTFQVQEDFSACVAYFVA